MIVSDKCELLHIDKNNLMAVADEDTLNSLRGNSQSKDRLYKQQLDKISKMTSEQFLK